eukprot:323663_1
MSIKKLIIISFIIQNILAQSASPTLQPPSVAGPIELYLFYNETCSSYWTSNIDEDENEIRNELRGVLKTELIVGVDTILLYGNIIQDAVFLSLKDVTTYSMHYGVDEYKNQYWTYGGITDWSTCYLFNMKVIFDPYCPSISNPDPSPKNADFVAVVEFKLIADQNEIQFKDWIIMQLSQKSFEEHFHEWLVILVDIEINKSKGGKGGKSKGAKEGQSKGAQGEKSKCAQGGKSKGGKSKGAQGGDIGRSHVS